METEQLYSPKESYIRTATACPEVNVADVSTNVERIKDLYQEAVDQCVSLVAFPEMSVTGYTLGDLVQQSSLLKQAEVGLLDLAEATKDMPCAMVVGLPVRLKNSLYNCAAVLADGEIKGIVPKTNLPTYNEFYEDRWFQSWDHPTTNINLGDKSVPFGTNLIFDVADTLCGVEICEDLWVADPPSGKLAMQGAQLIINPSASPEQVGKSNWRRDLVRIKSGSLICGYLYAGCDESESTSEIVMGGHQLITVNGNISAESKPFSDNRLLVSDIDIDHLNHDRRRLGMASMIGELIVKTNVSREQTGLNVNLDKNPFLPDENPEERSDRLQQIFTIQARALARRLRTSKQKKLVLGLSGGLDSTLALLVAVEAAHILNKEPADVVQTITMPGLASSDETQSNAQILSSQFGVPNVVIPINNLCNNELDALSHDRTLQDVTYENVQARIRENLLLNYANMHGGIVLGTGDLSEIAVGWCTYNADQQSHYHVNASIPKSVVRELVRYLADKPENKEAHATLHSIIETPISPELTRENVTGISQLTDSVLGPEDLREFFLPYLVRWGDSPSKITYLAEQAYKHKYTKEEIDKYWKIFITFFARSQFKRDNMPAGPKTGFVSLSPRGDWRMPPDLINAAVWSVVGSEK
jgi:NAD+ synthase (glutamine-hydrolysing)